jgi:hypothetical protein
MVTNVNTFEVDAKAQTKKISRKDAEAQRKESTDLHDRNCRRIRQRRELPPRDNFKQELLEEADICLASFFNSVLVLTFAVPS